MSERGQAGQTGATGTPGAIGASGATGSEGRAGIVGDQGAPGLRGERGRPGRLPDRLGLIFLMVALSMAAVLALFAYVIVRNSTAREALCAQRDDLDKRIVTSQALLNRYPHDPAFRDAVGIPRALVATSLAQSQETRKNLSILDC